MEALADLIDEWSDDDYDDRSDKQLCARQLKRLIKTAGPLHSFPMVSARTPNYQGISVDGVDFVVTRIDLTGTESHGEYGRGLTLELRELGHGGAAFETKTEVYEMLRIPMSPTVGDIVLALEDLDDVAKEDRAVLNAALPPDNAERVRRLRESLRLMEEVKFELSNIKVAT